VNAALHTKFFTAFEAFLKPCILRNRVQKCLVFFVQRFKKGLYISEYLLRGAILLSSGLIFEDPFAREAAIAFTAYTFPLVLQVLHGVPKTKPSFVAAMRSAITS